MIAKPLSDGGARQVVLEALWLDRWRADFASALARRRRRGHRRRGARRRLLRARGAARRSASPDALSQALRDAGARDVRAREVGSHAPRFEMRAAG